MSDFIKEGALEPGRGELPVWRWGGFSWLGTWNLEQEGPLRQENARMTLVREG